MRVNYPYLYRDLTNIYSWLPQKTGGGWAFPPIQVLMELTYRCNQRCAVCQFLPLLKSGAMSSRGGEMTTGEIRRIIDQLPPLALLTFTGGEPLLRADLPELVRYAGRSKLLQIISNGTLLTPQLAKSLLSRASKGLPNPGLIAFGISLQGNVEAHDKAVANPGSYEKAMVGIDNLLAARRGKYPLLSLKTVITPETLPQLPQLYRLANAMGLEYFNPILENTGAHFERVDLVDDLREVDARLSVAPPLTGLDAELFAETVLELAAMAKELPTGLRFTPQNVPPGDLIAIVRGEFQPRDHLCNVFWNALYISAFGDFLACASHVLGNLRKQSLSQIWNGEAVRQLRLHRLKQNILPGCSGCCYLFIRPGHSHRYQHFLPNSPR